MPLEPPIRTGMAAALGGDFSQVRIHTGAAASGAARRGDATAYTFGPHVVFDAGMYAPHTAGGRRLLAHELIHVQQQGFAGFAAVTAPWLQRAPKRPGVAEAQDLPFKSGGMSLFGIRARGIEILVGAANEKQEKKAGANAAAIARQVAAANAQIADPKRRVKVCFIVTTTTRFAYWRGDPVLMLDHDDADAATAAHEMGHAIFDALLLRETSRAADAAKAGHLRLRIADIYSRLEKTTPTKDLTVSVGLMIADPTTWSSATKSEHPWLDPDEFFASARKAFVLNPKGFRKAIDRAVKVDPAVKEPAEELLKLLRGAAKAALPAKGPPETRVKTAKFELGRIKPVSNVEETAATSRLLEWLIDPDTRPEPD